MSVDPEENECRRRMSRRAQEDFLLGTKDQIPEFDTSLVSMNERLTQLVATFQERSDAKIADLRGGLSLLDEKLSAAADQTAEIFSQPAAGTLRAKVSFLRKTTSEFYALFQRRLKRDLSFLSDESTFFSGHSRELQSFYQGEFSRWPEKIRLVYPRRSDQTLAGSSIWDLHQNSLIDNWCRHRLKPLVRLHFWISRLLLHFKYKIVPVPLREDFGEYFIQGVTLHDPSLSQQQRQRFRDLTTKVEDTWQSVRYNLEVAAVEAAETLDGKHSAEEVDAKVTELKELVVGALQRARRSMSEIELPCRELLRWYLDDIKIQHDQKAEHFKEHILRSGTFRGHWQRTWRSLRKNSHRLVSVTAEFLRQLVRTSRPLIGRLYLFLENLFLGAASWLGISLRPAEKLLELSDLPREERLAEKLKTLPPIYRRLFSAEALQTREFVVGREEEVKQFSEVVSRWVKGLRANAVVIGQNGTGKTSLVNCLMAEIGDEHLTSCLEIDRRLSTETHVLQLFNDWMDFDDPPRDLDELVTRLRDLPRQILFVELAHNLMLRTVGGRRGAEAFLYVLTATRDHLLWILTIREQPWIMFEYQLSLSRYFIYQIQTRFHETEDLKRAILLRNRASGCRLLYEDNGVADRRIRKTRLTRKIDSPELQALLEQHFFETLFDTTAGNMRAAVDFWVNAINYDKAADVIRVKPCIKPDVRIIGTFDPVLQFTLAELLNHGYLTVDEHAQIFLQEKTASRMMLDYLANVRLVNTQTQKESGITEYTLNPMLTNPILETLRAINLLY